MIIIRLNDKLLYILSLLLAFLVELTLTDVITVNFKAKDKLSGQEEKLDLCVLRKVYDKNEQSQAFNLLSLEPNDGCDGNKLPANLDNYTAIYLKIQPPFNCYFVEVIKNVQALYPKLVIIGTDGPIGLNSSVINLTAPYLFMPNEFAVKLSGFIKNSLPDSVNVYMNKNNGKFDFSLIAIWFIAILTIILGAFWTKHEFLVSLSKLDTLTKVESNQNLVNTDEANKVKNDSKEKSSDDNITTISVGYVAIFSLLVFVVAILLLLYFFYNVMIYFVYVVFCFGSTLAFYRIGSLFLDNIKILSCKLPKINLPFIKNYTPNVAKIFLLIGSVALTVSWFVFRHKHWVWIIQNIMALSLAINALSYYRLNSFKTIALILTLFFLYDIFMVFITPQFTNGSSIMEAVAFGGKDASNSNEQDWNNIQFTKQQDTSNRLPVVIVVPHLTPNKRLCAYYYDYAFTLLGLGDILIPGLSVNYAIIFDVASSNKNFVYFISNVIGYVIGLFLAFVGLLFMNTAQPALLYLCPMLILCSLITALIRKEIHLYWSGKPISDMIKSFEAKKSFQPSSSIDNNNAEKRANNDDNQSDNQKLNGEEIP